MFFLKIVESFERHGLDYAVAGQYAAALHGYVQNLKELEFIVDGSETGLHEVKFALQDCELFLFDKADDRWIFKNSKNAKESVVIYTGVDVNDCKCEIKSIYSYKIPVMTLFELQKKMNFQIARPKLLNERSFQLKPVEILQILEDYRLLDEQGLRLQKEKSILISMKVPEGLLEEFKEECASKNLKYQTQIKKLMKQWLD